MLRATDPGRSGGQKSPELQSIQMPPAPFRGMVMNRAFLLAMWAGKARSRRMVQVQIDPLRSDVFDQSRNRPWIVQTKETLVMTRDIYRGLEA